VNAKYGQTYFNAEECVQVDILNESCENVTVHTGTRHKIHEIGTNLKMYGLGSAIILETDSEQDATILKLLNDSIMNDVKFRNEQRPRLQLIVVSPDFAALDLICQDLEIARHHQQCSREDMEETIRVIQRQADKLVRMIDNLDDQVTDKFKKLTDDYVTSCLNEIEQHAVNHRETAKTSTGIRKQLMKAFVPYVVYMNQDGGFK
jgi:hypothetical protein